MLANGYNRSQINTVEEIKNRCNIVDVIGKVVTLKKAGSTYKGLCPFHNEKTPSFVVYEGNQHYKCFGCNEGGDVFNFVQKYYNLDFKEAVEMLAKEYGVEVNMSFSSSKSNDEFYEINRQAAIFFYKSLRQTQNPGYGYMIGRGIKDETLKTFGIGYADDNWTSLTDYLVGLGYDKDKLVEVGLTSKNEGKYYDKFRGRVIFPIQNTAGKVIGFGGRILDKGEPKYLNSKESSAFQKKNNLYGLNVSKEYVHKQNSIILVEGYMDVISLYQAGVRNVSASLGTALTENQAKLIKRYTNNVVLSYDADNAGQTAALRGVDILYREGCRPKVLVVDDGKDPDEYIKNNGRESFLALIDKALPYGDFKLAKAMSKYNLEIDEEKLDFLRDAIAILKEMKPVEADMYIGTISNKTGISENAIRREYEDDSANSRKPDFIRREKENVRNQSMSLVEQDLVKLMLLDRAYTELPDDIEDFVFNSVEGASIYKAILSEDDGNRPLNMNNIYDKLDIEASETLRKISLKTIPPDKENLIYRDCIRHIRRNKLEEEIKEITMILHQLDDEKDKEEIERLMHRMITIQGMLKK